MALLTRHLFALAFFGVAAVLFTWPLASVLPTHLPGDPTGDTGVYVWNLWVFAREWASPTGIYRTDAIFPLTGDADLGLHNYTVASNLLALPVIGLLGPVVTFNLVYFAQLALAGYAVFVLARHVTGSTRGALAAGLAFAFSPALTSRGTAHFSLVAAAPLALFAYATLRALEQRGLAWAVAAGGALAWATYSDVYYGVYCLVVLAAMLAHHALHVAPATARPWTPAERRVARLAGLALAAGGAIAVSGGGDVVIAGLTVHARTAYTPMLVATVLGLVVAACRVGPRLRYRPGTLGARAATGLLVCATVSAVLLFPLLQVLVTRWADGRWMATPLHWRTSPPGLDLLAFLLPSPTHPLWGQHTRTTLGGWHQHAFPEFVGSLPLVALLAVGVLAWRRGALPERARVWVLLAAVAASLALGPFLTIAGVNTCVPGPWALLRYVPVIGWARSPTRFVVVATLALSVLLAFAVRDLLRSRRGRWAVAALAALLVFELSPVPRTVYAATPPDVYALIAADPDPLVRVLELPVGIRDGASSLGDFSPVTQFFQTSHGKPIVGGYLSRVSERRKRRNLRIPTMRALVKLSAGEVLLDDEESWARLTARRFVLRGRIGYVVIDRWRAPDALRDFAIEALDLRLIARAGERDLYRPAAWPPPEPIGTR